MRNADEALKSIIVDVIQKTHGDVGQAIDFIQEQSPDLIKQFLLYNTISSSVWLLVGLAILLPSLLTFKKAIYLFQNDGGPFCLIIILNISGAIIGFIAMIFNLLTLSKIIIAPKLYLLEYIVSIVK